MIDITKLYCSRSTTGDSLRYGRKPVIAWNAIRTCNLNCVHCYTDFRRRPYSDELSNAEAQAMIDDLAGFGAPGLLFSGGKPLMREDVLELVDYARQLGIRPVLSTNGTLITPAVAGRMKRAGLTCVGISLDGTGEVEDRFRGRKGAFETAMEGFRNCVAAGRRGGLRLTLTKRNFRDLDSIFDFIEPEKIHRACFYHLVYSGRGGNMLADDLSHEQTRQAMNLILRRTEEFHRRGLNIDILTVDNRVDGVYLCLELLKKDPQRAGEVYGLLVWNGGGAYGSGAGIGNTDFQGNVHPDRFWTNRTFGNVRQRPFGGIWTDLSEPLMTGLKSRLPLLRGRCEACRWKPLCGGSLRARAEKVYGDPWMQDPACYLTDEEMRKEFSASTDNLAAILLWKKGCVK